MRCAWTRALTSTPPPAANGTISVTGRAGHSCARAGAPSAMRPAAAAMIILRMRVSLPGLTFAPMTGGIKARRSTALRRTTVRAAGYDRSPILEPRMARMQRNLGLIQLPMLSLGATMMMLGSAAAQTPDVRFSNPPTMAKPGGYSHVVEVNGPGRTIYIAGTARI